jgi:carbamoyltransferase
MNEEIILAVLDEHDPSAAIFVDGRLAALGEEERFIRQKHAADVFPIESIKFVLKDAKISIDDVDVLAYGWDCTKYPLEMAEVFLNNCYPYQKNEKTVMWELDQLRTRSAEVVNQKITNSILKEFETVPPIRFVDHHHSHAMSAFYFSGFDSSAVLTADGYGEQNAVVGWDATKDGLEKLFSFQIPNSLGWYMFAVTAFLGFRPNNGEGKVMGLAPYGKSNPQVRQVLQDVLTVEEEEFRVDPSYIYYGTHSYNESFTDKLVEKLPGSPRNYNDPILQFHKDVAFEAQKLLEEALLMCGRRVIEESSSNNLCLAGGIALNCKANMRLREELDLTEIFIQPLAGDNGIPMGAGITVSNKKERFPTQRMNPPYFGWQADSDDILDAINTNNEIELILEGKANIQSRIADELVNGKIIGRYSGRMECGPRALGNRSIISDPSDKRNLIAVNKVKKREEWRPFAPTILEEHAQEYLVGDYFDPFMIQTYEVKNDGLKDLEATVHVDNTTRPQVLTKDANPDYWELINSFYQVSGVPAVLNTSFNLAGDPIVRTPQEAIDTFLDSSMDYLQLEKFLVSKTDL